MANDKPEVAYNVEEGIKLGITATGRKLQVVSAKVNALYRIAFADGKQGGQIPNKYSGKYTSHKAAQLDLNRFIRETWQVASESTTKKSKAAA